MYLYAFCVDAGEPEKKQTTGKKTTARKEPLPRATQLTKFLEQVPWTGAKSDVVPPAMKVLKHNNVKLPEHLAVLEFADLVWSDMVAPTEVALAKAFLRKVFAHAAKHFGEGDKPSDVAASCAADSAQAGDCH